MYHVVVVEAAEDMDDGIRLAYVAKKLVAKPLALRGSLHEACDIDNLHRRRHDASRVYQLRQHVQALVRNGDDAHVGLDGAKGEVCALSLCVAQAVKEGGLAYVWQSYYTTL